MNDVRAHRIYRFGVFGSCFFLFEFCLLCEHLYSYINSTKSINSARVPPYLALTRKEFLTITTATPM